MGPVEDEDDMQKLPAWHFYVGDWRKDPGVQALDYFDRGVWHEILCIMFESEPRGKLTLNGQKMPDEALARILSLDIMTLTTTLTKLISYGIAKVEDMTAIVYCKRMVEDEKQRLVKRKNGALGGNPSLLRKNGAMTLVNQEDNQSGYPKCEDEDEEDKSKDKEYEEKGFRPCPHKKIIDLFHRNLPQCPRVRVWTSTRESHLATRWKEDPERQALEWWDDFFRYISKSSFLTGKVEQNSRKPFFATLDWIVKLENFAKILEGKYE